MTADSCLTELLMIIDYSLHSVHVVGKILTLTGEAELQLQRRKTKAEPPNKKMPSGRSCINIILWKYRENLSSMKHWEQQMDGISALGVFF